MKQIHHNLVIADQWNKPHSPLQIPEEFYGVKYLKSHAQVLIDRTGAPNSLMFLTLDYLKCVQNLSANLQINRIISEQVSKGGKRKRGNFILLMFNGLNLFCI
jgi:hypothetical protein